MAVDLDAIVERAKEALNYAYADTSSGRYWRSLRVPPAVDILALAEEVRRGNFFRDRLAERLSLAETAVVELECALSADPSYDPNHWRHHAESALDLCKRATLSRVPAEEATD